MKLPRQDGQNYADQFRHDDSAKHGHGDHACGGQHRSRRDGIPINQQYFAESCRRQRDPAEQRDPQLLKERAAKVADGDLAQRQRPDDGDRCLSTGVAARCPSAWE